MRVLLLALLPLAALGCVAPSDSSPQGPQGPQGEAQPQRRAAATPGPEGAQEENPGSEPALPAPSLQALRREAHRVVDDWHAAAAVGDRDRYLGHLAPDAIFMGTDSSERWDLATFSAYVDRYFEPGSGWTYVPSERILTLDEDRSTGWFDERLTNAGYGELRGTGVLRRASSPGEDGDTWQLVHYSMTFTVPNDVAADVVGVIREFEAGDQ